MLWLTSIQKNSNEDTLVHLKDVVFRQPIIVADATNELTSLRVHINDMGAIEIFSFETLPSNNSINKIVYSSASVDISRLNTLFWVDLKHEYETAKLKCVHVVSETAIRHMYSEQSKNALVFGKSFQLLKSASCSADGKDIISTIEASQISSLQTGFLISPPMIDAMFQSQKMPALAIGSIQSNDTPLIPFSVDHVWFNVPILKDVTKNLYKSGDAWYSHCKILSDTETGGVVSNCTLFDSTGQAVLRIDGLRRRRVKSQQLQRSISKRLSQSNLLVSFQNTKLVSSYFIIQSYKDILSTISTKDVFNSCLYVEDNISNCFVAGEGNTKSTARINTPCFDIKLKSSCNNLISTHGMFMAENTIVECFTLSSLTTKQSKYDIAIVSVNNQTNENMSNPIQIECAVVSAWLQLLEHLLPLVSRIFFVIESNDPFLTDCNPMSMSFVSLIRTAKLEYTGVVMTIIEVVTEVGLSSQERDSLKFDAIAREIRISQQRNTELEVSYREKNTKRYVRRYKPLQPSFEKGPWELNLSSRGSLDNLILQKQLVTDDLRPNEVKVEVVAVSLNFKDVLNVLGLYPGVLDAPGIEMSGIITKIGSEVTQLNVGDEVFGTANFGCLRQIITCMEVNVVKKPANLSIVEVSTIPIVFGTVINALRDIAKLTRGEVLLLHAAAGGVGLTAIQYAKHVGARVFATASSGKHEFLRNLGVEMISTSRDPDTFLKEAKQLLGPTGTVNVVLNCLSGKYIEYSLDLLSTNGRFVEIGKRGVWSEENVKNRRPDVLYNLLALDNKRSEDPIWFNSFLRDIVKEFELGIWKPVNVNVFDFCSEYIDAFQLLMKGRSIGKVVLYHGFRLFDKTNLIPSTVLSTSNSNSAMTVRNGVYIITGGLGGLGLLTAQILIRMGVTRLILVSRTGKVNRQGQGLEVQLAEIQKQPGIILRLEACDVCNESALKLFLEKIRLEGEYIGMFQSIFKQFVIYSYDNSICVCFS